MKHLRLGRNIFYLACLGFVAFQFSTSISANGQADCKDVLIVFARGSGQNGGVPISRAEFGNIQIADNEKQTLSFFENLRTKISGTKEFVSLHDFPGKYNNYGYAAVDVAGGMSTRPNHTFFMLNRYNESVMDGKNELVGFLHDRIEQCPAQKIVVGGYSQGAEVVGDAMFALTPYDRTHISYVSLFGDPKFNPHLSGLSISKAKWVRGNNFGIFTGILGARRDYLPNDIPNKTSWCDRSDPICTGSKNIFLGYAGIVSDFGDKTHSTAYQNKWIAQAANEIALTVNNSKRIDKTIGSVLVNNDHATKKLDVMIVLDATGYMNYEVIQLTRSPVLQKFVDSVYGQNWDTRVGVVTYNDDDDHDPGSSQWYSMTRANLTYDRSTVVNALSGVWAQNMENHNAAMYSGIMTAINGQQWRHGAQKKILIISNTKPRDPDPGPGHYTQNDVIKAMLNLDPAVGSVIALPDRSSGGKPTSDATKQLVASTNGTIVNGSFSDGTTMAPIMSALTDIDNSPVAIISENPFYAQGYVELSGGESYDPDSSIVQYQWDCDNNGSWDVTDTQPIADCAYSNGYTGGVVLQVTSADNQSAKAILRVDTKNNPITTVATEPSLPLAPQVTAQRIDANTVKVTIGETSSEPATFNLYRDDSTTITPLTTATYTILDAPSMGFTIGVTAQNVAGESEITQVTVPEFMPSVTKSDDKVLIVSESNPEWLLALTAQKQAELDARLAASAATTVAAPIQVRPPTTPAANPTVVDAPTTVVAGISTKAVKTPTDTPATQTIQAHQSPELAVLFVALGLLGFGVLLVLWKLNKIKQ